MPARKTLIEIKLDIKSLYNGEYEYKSGVYSNQKSKIQIKHLSTGTIIDTTLRSFKEGKNLVGTQKRGHSTKKLLLNDYILRLSEFNPNIIYMDPENFNGRKNPGKFKCKVCNHEWSVARVEQLIEFKENKRTKCPVCANLERGKYLQDKNYLKDILKEAIDGVEYNWLEDYQFDNKKKYMIIHKTCGTVYNAQALSFKNGEQRCPTCFDNDSRHVRMIKSLLDSMNVLYETEKTFETCKNINVLPFDFYIEKYNLLIEYDGSQHFRPWGSKQELFEKLKYNDAIKDNWTKENNIELIRLNYKQSDKEIINIIKENCRSIKSF